VFRVPRRPANLRLCVKQDSMLERPFCQLSASSRRNPLRFRPNNASIDSTRSLLLTPEEGLRRSKLIQRHTGLRIASAVTRRRHGIRQWLAISQWRTGNRRHARDRARRRCLNTSRRRISTIRRRRIVRSWVWTDRISRLRIAIPAAPAATQEG
jgi:hypothetical protein